MGTSAWHSLVGQTASMRHQILLRTRENGGYNICGHSLQDERLMSDLDELAEAAQGYQSVSVQRSNMIRVGGYLLPCAAVESIEPTQGRRAVKMTGLGYVLIIGGAGALVLALRANDQDTAIGGLISIGVGALWLLLVQRRVYGWKIHCFHRPSIAIQYETPAQAERMLTYLRHNLPHVPVQRPQVMYFWWIRF